MRRSRHWAVIAIWLAACGNSQVTERDVDAALGTDSACATSDATASCTEDAAAKDAQEAGSDTGIASPGEGGCKYLGQHFDDGVTFPSNDGCNSCECRRGAPSCTLAGCFGRRPAHCDLPFDPGSCDESHLYYWHNPSTGLCEPKPYSGCGGNLNRFEDYVDCAYRCSLNDGPGQDCAYEGQTFQHRERVARKPSEMTGCGPCLCNDGHVLCPPAGCQCPAAQKLGLECIGCLAAGGCSYVQERCFPVCGTDADCDTKDGVFCDEAQGVCVATTACL